MKHHLLSKHTIIPVVCLFIAGIVAFIFLSPASSYQGPPSDHFDGKTFFNEEPDHTFTDMVKWLWEMNTVDWPTWVNDPPQPKPVAFVNGNDLKFTYINHATTLIQMDSLNILTDPIWSMRASPVSWIGTKRVRAPGVKLEDLPKIDVILISHDHYDHLDLPTLKQLVKIHNPLILVGLGVKPLLVDEGITNVIEMDWWQNQTLHPANVKITFVPARHTSGRSMWGGNQTLWGGFVIEGSGGRVFFAGDTGYGNFLQAIKERFDNFRLTILPIGNYEKRWFMKSQHMNPEDAVRVHKLLNSGQSVGIHYATFLEHAEQTIDAHQLDLADALKDNGLNDSTFWVLKFGEGKYVAR
jgi:L-ascorbate metabolism protein UlaG (beta-lactamase superfamily)